MLYDGIPWKLQENLSVALIDSFFSLISNKCSMYFDASPYIAASVGITLIDKLCLNLKATNPFSKGEKSLILYDASP